MLKRVAIVAVLAVWGLVATPAPVAWGVWLGRTLPDDAEAGGGLMVAAIQMAITLGAGLGGALFDMLGWWPRSRSARWSWRGRRRRSWSPRARHGAADRSRRGFVGSDSTERPNAAIMAARASARGSIRPASSPR